MTNDQPTEHIEFSDQDVEDLASLGVTAGDLPEFHPILEVWREVLKPARTESTAKVTPQYANRIVSSYRDIGFADMENFRDRFYAKIMALEDILLAEIDSDDQCLLPSTPEEDKKANSGHYRNLLLEWQKEFLRWELEWETTDPAAAVELGAIGETHKMIFGGDGITAFLQNIQFEFTEQQQAEIQAELQAMKDGGEK
jgi:hypothetical protein